MKTPTLYIIIPCYNEEQVLPITSGIFLKKLLQLIKDQLITPESKIVFINDGSKDSTWEIIKELCKKEYYLGICLSRNRGHQNALLAGLLETKDLCDITISIDCDGQDDINAMDDMICAYYKGADIVYGVRNNRDSDTCFKKFTAEMFYKIMTKLGVESIYNHADYRLVSSKILEELARYKEVNLFLRGMFPLIGFNSTCVYYKRETRIAGESHYPLSKMISLAVNGITSLSIQPIRYITYMGILVSLLSGLGIIWAVLCVTLQIAISGWTSMICIICFLGGGTNDISGNYRRIYWQNLFRDKRTAKILYQRIYI